MASDDAGNPLAAEVLQPILAFQSQLAVLEFTLQEVILHLMKSAPDPADLIVSLQQGTQRRIQRFSGMREDAEIAAQLRILCESSSKMFFGGLTTKNNSEQSTRIN